MKRERARTFQTVLLKSFELFGSQFGGGRHDEKWREGERERGRN